MLYVKLTMACTHICHWPQYSWTRAVPGFLVEDLRWSLWERPFSNYPKLWKGVSWGESRTGGCTKPTRCEQLTPAIHDINHFTEVLITIAEETVSKTSALPSVWHLDGWLMAVGGLLRIVKMLNTDLLQKAKKTWSSFEFCKPLPAERWKNPREYAGDNLSLASKCVVRWSKAGQWWEELEEEEVILL